MNLEWVELVTVLGHPLKELIHHIFLERIRIFVNYAIFVACDASAQQTHNALTA
jgi:hypothetical protein